MENSITQEIELVIGVLSNELSRTELENGWTKQSQTKWLAYFVKLLHDVKSKKAIPPVFIAKWMDGDGICKGDLFEKGANISCRIRECSNENNQNA